MITDNRPSTAATQQLLNLLAIITRPGYLTLVFVVTFPLAVAASTSGHQVISPEPSPVLDPAEVVRIQVEALRNNSSLNEGIALTYRFASPNNRRSTGPLGRFTVMVRTDPYDRLLNHRRARYEPLALSGNVAHQLVIITDPAGEEIAYHWTLVRQEEGKFKDCWMTDAVIPSVRPALRVLTLLTDPRAGTNNIFVTRSNR
jgi:hypothetical protein